MRAGVVSHKALTRAVGLSYLVRRSLSGRVGRGPPLASVIVLARPTSLNARYRRRRELSEQ